jgi:rod shape-determining protein MreC
MSEKIKKIEEKNLTLMLKVKELDNLKKENERLRKALLFRDKKKLNIMGVDIVSFDPSSWRRIVLINAGEDKDIKEGAFVIDEEGYLVGKIVEVKATYSRLMLINDPDFSLSVFVGENVRGLLKGGLGEIKVLYIEVGEKIKTDDKVWAKPPSLNIPLYIGKVKSITVDRNSLFLNVSVRLFSDRPLVHRMFVIK